MTSSEIDSLTRQLIRATYGDTGDLCEELVNTLANVCYFATKSQKQNLGGLTDLRQIHANKEDHELIPIYMAHMQHVALAVEFAPELVKKLRQIRKEDTGSYPMFEQLTIDILKYDIQNAESLTERQRAKQRRQKVPNELPRLADRLGLRYRVTD